MRISDWSSDVCSSDLARQRLDNEMAAFRQTMQVQSGIVENVRDDAQTLAAIVAKSQGAEGSLQAQQATNQLLALATTQQFQLQNLMVAQFRTESLEAARRGQSAREARVRTSRFLGDGKAYKIGRESCRERGCQYGYNSVGAVS